MCMVPKKLPSIMSGISNTTLNIHKPLRCISDPNFTRITIIYARFTYSVFPKCLDVLLYQLKEKTRRNIRRLYRNWYGERTKMAGVIYYPNIFSGSRGENIIWKPVSNTLLDSWDNFQQIHEIWKKISSGLDFTWKIIRRYE